MFRSIDLDITHQIINKFTIKGQKAFEKGNIQGVMNCYITIHNIYATILTDQEAAQLATNNSYTVALITEQFELITQLIALEQLLNNTSIIETNENESVLQQYTDNENQSILDIKENTNASITGENTTQHEI